jgi:hypothetical protein
MACIGIYYGIPSLVLRRDRLKDEVTAGGAVVLAVLLLALFFLYRTRTSISPRRESSTGSSEAQAAIPDVLSFFLLALIAAVRVRGSLLAALLLASNAVLMMKAHIACDKYALPLIVVLWYLEGSGKWTVDPSFGPRPPHSVD